jgi:hypothetical protein
MMNCKEWLELFQTWLTGHWLPEKDMGELPGTLKDHANVCKACNTRLKSAQLLLKKPGLTVMGFNDTAPAGLSEKITRHILDNRIRTRYGKYSWIFVPLAAAALIMITFFFTLTFFTGNESTITIHLMIEVPGASTVSVVGDWNGWNPGIDMLKDPEGDGIWEIKLRLDKNNEYRYQFLINGREWVPDPASPVQVDDGFGGINSVLEI